MISLDFLDNNYEDNRPLSEIIEERIAISILSKEYYPGQRLSEQKLCDKYNMSRIPIREILNRLAKDGYIELIPNRGAFVKDLNDDYLNNLMQLKNLLYPQVFAWATERMTSEEFDILEEVFGFIKFYAPTLDVDKCINFAQGFDKIMYSCAKNVETEKLMNKIDFIIKYIKKDITLPFKFIDQLLNEYTQIFEAVKIRNVSQVIEAAQIRSFRQMLLFIQE